MKLPGEGIVDNAEARKKFDLQARILNRRRREGDRGVSYIRDTLGGRSSFRRKSKDRKAARTSDIKGREIRDASTRDWHSRLIHACLIFACSLKRLTDRSMPFPSLPSCTFGYHCESRLEIASVPFEFRTISCFLILNRFTEDGQGYGKGYRRVNIIFIPRRRVIR